MLMNARESRAALNVSAARLQPCWQAILAALRAILRAQLRIQRSTDMLRTFSNIAETSPQRAGFYVKLYRFIASGRSYKIKK